MSNLFRLLWSFVRQPGEWLWMFEHRNDSTDAEVLQEFRQVKRTMWGD